MVRFHPGTISACSLMEKHVDFMYLETPVPGLDLGMIKRSCKLRVFAANKLSFHWVRDDSSNLSKANCLIV